MDIEPFAHNQLAHASSPYLRQHAGNPVHWQQWNDATLDHARATDTPILLSVGYSACHWCHVMAHECFEDPAIAAVMNAKFVNIKLDREERPDIDKVYLLAHQALTGQPGGWPLTLFLDPQDLAPFYAGTYFPPTPRAGRPGFPEVLAQVRTFFDTHRADLRSQTAELHEWLRQMQKPAPVVAVDGATVRKRALEALHRRFDAQWGGSTGAPKFPRAAELEWLLDDRDPIGLQIAHRTLLRMAERGLQDHLGGGFFRYCVDLAWSIPHFEKMLYDNAQLLAVYARVARAEGVDADLRGKAETAVRGVVDWLEREMKAPGGAYCSALSADNTDGEGAYYVWTRDEFGAALPASVVPIAEAAFGLDRPPNFERRAWHLLRAVADTEIAKRAGVPLADVQPALADASRLLFKARERRPHPPRDDKILTAWNALAVSALARASRMLDDGRCRALALRVLDALRASVWLDGRLYANAAAADARIPAFLDDHALLLDALLETLQLRFDTRDLAWAGALADALCERFVDPESGAFWFSSEQHATPLARSRDWPDDALPNGNATAIRSLLRLGHLTGNERWLAVAARALRAGGSVLQQYPDVCPSLMRALAEYEQPRPQVVVRCPAAQSGAWEAAVREGLRAAGIAPGGDPVDVFVIPADATGLPDLLVAREPRGAQGAAYVCSGLTCQAPVTAPADLDGTIRALRPGRTAGPAQHQGAR